MAIAIGIAASMQFVLPMAFAVFAGLPFALIGVYAAWRQRGIPSEAKTAQIFEAARALSREQFASLIEEAFRRDGHKVAAYAGDAADIEAKRPGVTTLVSYRRWKTAQIGVAPVRELAEAMQKAGASRGAVLVGGEVSDAARQLAAEKGITLVEGPLLAKLLARPLKALGK